MITNEVTLAVGPVLVVARRAGDRVQTLVECEGLTVGGACLDGETLEQLLPAIADGIRAARRLLDEPPACAWALDADENAAPPSLVIFSD